MPPERARRDIGEVRGGRVSWRRVGGTFSEGRIQAGCRRWLAWVRISFLSGAGG